MKLWNITYYQDDSVYDEEIVSYPIRPTKYARAFKGLSTECTIERIEGDEEMENEGESAA